jgi:HAD superfamily hydrolase (TIGR01549 family)
MENNNNVCAVIWDFDGTLVDSKQKNFNVTKKIIEKVTGRSADSYPIFDSVEKYYTANTNASNWRIFYEEVLDISTDKISEVGRLWTEFQMNDDTPINFHSGIVLLIENLGSISHGIVSQSSKDIILQELKNNNISEYFKCVIGYEEVDIKKQKPEPDGLLFCLKKLTGLKSGTVFYIGDLESDIQCAINANLLLKKEDIGIDIISIAAKYDSVQDLNAWDCKPDHIAETVEDIYKIINQRNKCI